MGDNLLVNLVEEDERKSKTTKIGIRGLFKEVKDSGFLAAPLIAILLSQYLTQISTLMIVGRPDELSLSSTALAISLSGVSGFSILLGMASALETLCGQAYGAEQYQKLGTHTYCAIFCLLIVSIPVAVLWIFMGKLLVLFGQDPLISHEAGKFMIWLIPALFAYAFLQPLLKYFQMQVLIMPILVISFFTVCLHIPLCWGLVYKTGLRNIGGALAMGISNWLNVILLVFYMIFSPKCAKTRGVISMELFQGIGEFIRLAVPSAVMICLEWWSFELIIILSGLMPNPQLETSVLSVCFNTVTTIFNIAFGISAAGSTRVSNELGAGKAEAARLATIAVTLLAAVEAIAVSVALFALRHIFGYAFSGEKEVVDYVSVMTPLVCLLVMMDSIRGVLQGVARGCGWQHIAAYINLGAFYLCGIPAALILGFCFKLRGMGLWIGIETGAFVQTLLLCVVISCMNWEKQAIEARERIFEGRDLVL